MNIPYEKIFNTIALFAPIKLGVKIKKIGQKLKVKRNLRNI